MCGGRVSWSLHGGSDTVPGHLWIQWIQKVQRRYESGTWLVKLVGPEHVGHCLEEVVVFERFVARKGRSVVS